MMAAMTTPEVVMVSGDLLFASRLRAALAGVAEVGATRGEELPAAGTVFVDLNEDVDARLELIRALRARQASCRIIGFCQHEERDVRVRAMAAGADQVVTNGALQAAALRLLGAGARG
jgi:DNA-binding NarL/FixJ family response regulator